jgi:aminoglycoside phosphotransferase
MIQPESIEHADHAYAPAGDTDDNPGDVLTRRLAQLQDPGWVKHVLELALGQLTPAPVSVDDYHIEYCKIKPGRDINVALQLALRCRTGGATFLRRVSCTLFPSALKGDRRFHEESRQPVPEATGYQLEVDEFERLIAFVPEPAMIVRVFPMDPVLMGLQLATDVDSMRVLLALHLRRCGRNGRQPQGLTYNVLHYKPGRTCTLHYNLALDRTLGSGRQTCQFYGKVYRDDRGGHCYELLNIAWEASCASDGLWQAARPVLHLPYWRLVVQEAVSGQQFRYWLAELTPDNAGEAELQQVEHHLKLIAAAIRSLQWSAPRLGPICDFAQLWLGQEKNLAYLGQSQPELAAEIAQIRHALRSWERQIPAAPLVFAHCDFAHGNVLVGDHGIGIIDFDRAGQAEPAYDVAYFLTHLWSFGIRHPKRQAHIARLCACFRNAYLDLAPEVSSARLALYEALDFSAYVLRNFRKQSHQANWLEWARGQVQAARDRLERAVRQGGTAV